MLFNTEPLTLSLPDAEIIYYPQFFDKEQADQIYAELLQEIAWQQDNITVFGKTHPQPRLTALYGNEGKPYSYSNITMQPNPWNTLLQKIKYLIEFRTECQFTTVLLNQYRDGKDSNGWHSDNEKELGTNPIIASLSFGAERVFQLKHNTIADAKKSIVLEHGSLLLMKGSTQHFWKHQIPKTTKPIGNRINLTFRSIK
ncbi:alpha-ketoglutarate-dependent dioxygenase AlkB [Flavobacterium sp.]|uniref:alpha-ketoglutarate-dependent dioxygenase AlkB family protein n=1 Tax=Flavobacterium sp. TaxID=239 RepID=UPI0008D53755|nr:alpha-ketoglutarate-dependent dioxygenase AlkB [Flavobacterium sp.]OGS65763.1 MAG: 2OG-Fe(II) oxygenase [Flavobacteria bacterium GWA2_35_26]HCF03009.1 alpha-ketoglutarate-dependent dioxygenase AlkB [Flavobacterium sp.]